MIKLLVFLYKSLKTAFCFQDKLDKKERKMSKKCIYCKREIDDNCVMDVCDSCGIGVWGKKMFYTIVKKMEEARERDDLVSTNTIGIGKLDKGRI